MGSLWRVQIYILEEASMENLDNYWGMLDNESVDEETSVEIRDCAATVINFSKFKVRILVNIGYSRA